MQESGSVRVSRRGGIKVGSTSAAAMDGGRTVVMKTTGKVAYSPRGSGMGSKAPLARRGGGGLAPVRQSGRSVVPLKTGTRAS
jgi:hypothetical protein